jgi:hypothetical protein
MIDQMDCAALIKKADKEIKSIHHQLSKIVASEHTSKEIFSDFP